jgi:hypothetical protein
MLQFKFKPFQQITFFTLFLLSCTQTIPGKDKEEVKASSVIKMLNKGQEVNFENKTITGDLDFSQVEVKTKIHTTLSQTVIKAAISFTKCQFKGKVICTGVADGITYQSVFMQNLIFNNCEFNSLADFQSVTVFGNVSFAGCQFNELALFNSFYSHAKASYFGQITAEKDFSMQDALFIGSCDFFKGHFKAGINFQGSRFDGLFNFSTVQCDSRADFSKVRFNNNCTFNYTVFTGIARFNQLRSLSIADFIQVQFNSDALFTNTLFYDLCKFNETKVAAGFDFTSAVFYRSAPVLDKIDITDSSLFKAGKVLQQDFFVLPKNSDK